MKTINLCNQQNLETEVLVIGSGAGGSITAHTLAKNGHDVLIVEEGDLYIKNKLPKGLTDSMPSMWRSGGLTTTLGNQISFAEGRCVGGGTEINSAIYQSLPSSIIDQWAYHNKIKNFSENIIGDYFERIRNKLNVSQSQSYNSSSSRLLKKAGKKMGWQVDKLERFYKDNSKTESSIYLPSNNKNPMSTSILPETIKKGARLLKKTKIKKILFKGDVAFGVEGVVNSEINKKFKIKIYFKSLFICCGATQTPLLLRRSGFKNFKFNNFQLHPTVKLLVKYDENINAAEDQLPMHAITEFMPEIRFGGSVFTTPTFGMSISEDWINRKKLLRERNKFAIYYVMIKPDGVGRMYNSFLMNDPLIFYKLTERDIRKIFRGVSLFSKALLLSGAKAVYPSINNINVWENLKDIENSKANIKNKNLRLMSIHIFSSCPLGEREDFCMTDSFGKVFGANNVFISDASILPSAPGVNPQATIMAFALRNAENFLDRK